MKLYITAEIKKKEEQKTAWKNYISVFAGHFKGRVEYYKVWNEPGATWCWKTAKPKPSMNNR